MADLIGAGSAGLGRFRVDRATGAVRYDPLASEGWPDDAVTETRLAVLVRDATGALALAEVAVDVTGPASAPTYATGGMIASATWDVVGDNYDDLSLTTVASARVTGSRGEGDDGVLLEAGGGHAGILLYIYEDILYFRCGSGRNADPTGQTNTAYITAPAPIGDFIIEWSASIFTDNAALYIDGVLAGSATFTNNQLAAGDGGSLGVNSSSAPDNLGGWGGNEGEFGGGVTEAIIYLDQITAEVEA